MLRLVYVQTLMLFSLGIMSIGKKIMWMKRKGGYFLVLKSFYWKRGCAFRLELQKSSAQNKNLSKGEKRTYRNSYPLPKYFLASSCTWRINSTGKLSLNGSSSWTFIWSVWAVGPSVNWRTGQSKYKGKLWGLEQW